MKKIYKFPKGFWWGSASSAEQSEGRGNTGKGKTIWDHWFEIEENRFYDEVGPEVTSDFFNRYEDDIKLMKKLGHNSFRMSLSWARLFPNGDGEVNKMAVEFYNNVINTFIENDIKPFVNLYHFDMPMAMQEKGGWESTKVVEAYVNYADKCFELFGDRVEYWFTFNEPLGPVLGGYMQDFHYPNIIDFKKAAQVAFNTILAHAKAVETFKKHNLKSKIGIILNLSPTYPRSSNKCDVEAAQICDLFYNRSFLDPCVKGAFPKKLVDILRKYEQMPTYTQEDIEIIKENTAQILGINYYEPRRAKAKENVVNPNSPFMPEWLFDSYILPGRKFNQYRGWEIYEKGILDLCNDVKENYGNIEGFISENGMGVADEARFIENGQINDKYRIEFIKGHLKCVHKAIEEGCNIKGYHLWTFIDCWSWMNAYKNRYGLVSLDLLTQKRTVKKSGEFYKLLSENNGFEE